MNTNKQVNAMIGLLFATLLVLGGYLVNEGNRQQQALEDVTERNAERGARLFAQNCRFCHGLVGAGPVEGGFGAQLNGGAYLVFGEATDVVYSYDAAAEELVPIDVAGREPTTQGVAQGIRSFLADTISCGRTGTFMPPWSQSFGGTLSDTQVNHLVTMITNGRWDLVVEIGHEIDEETGLTEAQIAQIVITDPSALSPTQSNCGQFRGADAEAFRARDPFASPAAAAAATATAEPAPTAAAPAPDGGAVVEVSLTEFSVAPAAETVAADGVTFRVANDGAVLHEFVVVRSDLASDALPVAGGVADESQLDVVGRIEQWGGGESRETALSLTAGKYLLICNLPGHYQLGMAAAFTVE